MTDQTYLDSLIPMLLFWYEMLSPDSELVLYNVGTQRVHYVVNPFDEEMFPGSEMRSLERRFLETRLYEQESYIVNYRALSKQRHKLKSGTYFFKEPEGELRGMLTVNENVERLLELRTLIDAMVSGRQPYDQQKNQSFYNSFDVSVEGIVFTAIREELDKFSIDPVRLSAQEKIRIVQSLDEKGIFLVKGAITELASLMKTTETTIYRYLNKKTTS